MLLASLTHGSLHLHHEVFDILVISALHLIDILFKNGPLHFVLHEKKVTDFCLLRQKTNLHLFTARIPRVKTEADEIAIVLKCEELNVNFFVLRIIHLLQQLLALRTSYALPHAATERLIRATDL